MNKMYHDAMTIVCIYGKLDLFILFTDNPKWSEIRAKLQSAQTSLDRPDLVAHVFYLKFKELMVDFAMCLGEYEDIVG